MGSKKQKPEGSASVKGLAPIGAEVFPGGMRGMFPGGMRSLTPRPHAPASLTSSRAPTAPRHFCILEAKAAAGEPRSSLATAKKSATLSCSGMVRRAPGALGSSGGGGERLPCGAPQGAGSARLSPAPRRQPRAASPAPRLPPPAPALRRHAAAPPARPLKAKSRGAPQELLQ